MQAADEPGQDVRDRQGNTISGIIILYPGDRQGLRGPLPRGLRLPPGHLQQEDRAPAHRTRVQRGGELQGQLII